MTDCVFCQIVAGDVAASIIHQDDICLAFADISPANPGHTLVIPRVHYERFDDLPSEVAGRMMSVARDVVAAVRSSSLRSEGFNLLLNNGAVAGQDVFHSHLHVIPRFGGDSFAKLFFPRPTTPPSRAVLDGVAAELREALGASTGASALPDA